MLRKLISNLRALAVGPSLNRLSRIPEGQIEGLYTLLAHNPRPVLLKNQKKEQFFKDKREIDLERIDFDSLFSELAQLRQHQSRMNEKIKVLERLIQQG
jgi:hypothetical protein